MKTGVQSLENVSRPAPAPDCQPLLRRKCACGGSAGVGGECAECGRKRLSRRRAGSGRSDPRQVPPIVHEVLRGSGQPLDDPTRADMEARFGHDFSRVRVHTDDRAARSAEAVNAEAYTAGINIVFAAHRYEPRSAGGRDLLAHELAHVTQQRLGGVGDAFLPQRIGSPDDGAEQEADAVAAAANAGSAAGGSAADAPFLRRKKSPRIKKVTVHLTPPQSAELAWEGTAPATAPGADSFTVSTGKGYGDPGDPPGTCKRDCCGDAATQCDSPHDEPGKVGSCCTYTGTKYWTGTPQAEHNGWKFWTPIQPYYWKRGIALHQHHEVTGKPIGHGCVRMDEANAQRIAEYSDGKNTNVTIDGRASPVGCAADRQCGAAGDGGAGAGLGVGAAEGATVAAVPPVPGLEGEMT